MFVEVFEALAAHQKQITWTEQSECPVICLRKHLGALRRPLFFSPLHSQVLLSRSFFSPKARSLSAGRVNLGRSADPMVLILDRKHVSVCIGKPPKKG